VASRGRRQDHYEVLGVTSEAPDEVVRAAYRALAGKYHPDRNPGDRNAELKLKRLNAAFQVLGDPVKRKQYDELTQSPEANDEPPPEPPRREAPRWKVPEEKPAPPEPRWKVRGEESRAHTVRTAAKKPPRRGLRLVLGCLAGGLSLYINLKHGDANQNVASLVGLLLGCGLLATIVYWLLSPTRDAAVTWMGFIGLGLAGLVGGLRNCDEKHEDSAPTTERDLEVRGNGGRGICGAHRVERQRSERHVVGRQFSQDTPDLAPVRVESPAKPCSVIENGAGAPLDGRVVGRSEIVVEEGVFSEQSESQGIEGVVDQIDDEELGGDEQAAELLCGHRFLAGALGLGVWAKTSRKSFSSRRASSRSAATASNSSARFIKTRKFPAAWSARVARSSVVMSEGLPAASSR
jgi:hypothetical protein